MGLLLALYVPLLWVVSSLLRGKGLVVAGAGLVGLAYCARAYAHGRRAPLYRLVTCTAAIAVSACACEALLRLFPAPAGRVMSDPLADYALGGYHGEPGGIYRRDPWLGHAMRPSFSRAMYWNGHAWWHSTNADGYRGARLTQADAVVLGDSMVYGHGVEVDQAVPARFEAHARLRAANLGQQGTCLVQGLELLRRTGLRLHPRLVLVCAHFTDPGDALHWYEPRELERFMSSTSGYRPAAGPAYREPPRGNVFDWWLRRMALPLRTGRALQFALAPPRAAVRDEATPAHGDGRFVPPAEFVAAPLGGVGTQASTAERLGWQAEQRALREIAREADAAGARLVVFDLGYPEAFSRAVETSARALGATYSDAGRRVLARVLAGEELYLARDGHWSPAGCDAVARALARALGR